MKISNIITGVVLVLSLTANALLFMGLNHDEKEIARANNEIAAANAANRQAWNDYRRRLIDLKTEHPLLFKDLQIPPPR